MPAAGGKTAHELNVHFYFSPGQKTARAVIEIRNHNAASRPLLNAKSSIASIRRTMDQFSFGVRASRHDTTRSDRGGY